MAVISAAQQYLTNKSMKALAAAAAKKAPPYSVNYSGTGEPARLLYGTVRVGGDDVRDPSRESQGVVAHASAMSGEGWKARRDNRDGHPRCSRAGRRCGDG